MFNKFKSLASKRLSNSPNKDGKADDKQAEEPSSAALYLQTLKNYSVLMEYKRLQQTAPAGVYLLPSPHSFSLFHGLIFVRKGHYRRAILAFTLTLPATYPAVPPAIAFTPASSELFHPLIASTGAVDTAHIDWQPNEHSLTHALSYVKKLFYKTDWWGDGDGGRRDARELWKHNRDEFNRRVTVCVAWSLDTLVDNGRAMHVTRPTQQHDRLWQRIAQHWKEDEDKEAEAVKQGGRQTSDEQTRHGYLQWFMPGEQSVVSREDAWGEAALGRGRIVVTAEEEKEWMEEERKRRAEERRQRVEAAAGKDEGEQAETKAELEAEAEVQDAQYAYGLDESITTGEEDLP